MLVADQVSPSFGYAVDAAVPAARLISRGRTRNLAETFERLGRTDPDELAANDVATLLRTSAILPAANAAEVIDQLVRVFGRDADDVHADLALLTNAGMTVTPIDADLALLAGRLHARHYHRERRAVSLADCVAAATGLSAQRSLATADPALAELVRREGGKVHALPDSAGRLP